MVTLNKKIAQTDKYPEETQGIFYARKGTELVIIFVFARLKTFGCGYLNKYIKKVLTREFSV